MASFLGLVKIEGPDRALRIGCFGLACAVAAVGGVALRAGTLLAPDVRADVAGWTEAGYSPEDARALVAYQRLGIRPAGREVGAAPAPVAALFASQTGLCGRLQRLPDPAVLNALRGEADPLAPALAAAVTQAAVADRPAVLQAALRQLCG